MFAVNRSVQQTNWQLWLCYLTESHEDLYSEVLNDFHAKKVPVCSKTILRQPQLITALFYFMYIKFLHKFHTLWHQYLQPIKMNSEGEQMHDPPPTAWIPARD
jgi:hypothetical protein